MANKRKRWNCNTITIPVQELRDKMNVMLPPVINSATLVFNIDGVLYAKGIQLSDKRSECRERLDSLTKAGFRTIDKIKSDYNQWIN